jgi:flagellin-like hook-associated protein FlgL
MFKQQAQDLSKVMGQIASGTRFTRPSDDFAAFSKVSQRLQEVTTRQTKQDDIAEGRLQLNRIKALTDSVLEHLKSGDNAGAAGLIAESGLTGANWNIQIGGTTIDIASLTIGTSAADTSASFGTLSGRLAGIESLINRHETLNTNIIAANQEAANSIGAIDEMSAMSQMASLTVRQNATVSMASQANLSQFAMLRLFA